MSAVRFAAAGARDFGVTVRESAQSGARVAAVPLRRVTVVARTEATYTAGTARDMTMSTVNRIGAWCVRTAVAACLTGPLVCGPAARAQTDPATSYHDCYKSLRSCQKQRCHDEVDLKQVECVRQCSREYDTCVSGARSGGAPAREVGGGKQKKPPRDLERYRTPGTE